MKIIATLLLATAPFLLAQVPNPTQQMPTAVDNGLPQPIFRVTVVSRTIPAINYQHRNGATKVDLHGTELMPYGQRHRGRGEQYRCYSHDGAIRETRISLRNSVRSF